MQTAALKLLMNQILRYVKNEILLQFQSKASFQDSLVASTSKKKNAKSKVKTDGKFSDGKSKRRSRVEIEYEYENQTPIRTANY